MQAEAFRGSKCICDDFDETKNRLGAVGLRSRRAAASNTAHRFFSMAYFGNRRVRRTCHFNSPLISNQWSSRQSGYQFQSLPNSAVGTGFNCSIHLPRLSDVISAPVPLQIPPSPALYWPETLPTVSLCGRTSPFPRGTRHHPVGEAGP